MGAVKQKQIEEMEKETNEEEAKQEKIWAEEEERQIQAYIDKTEEQYIDDQIEKIFERLESKLENGKRRT